MKECDVYGGACACFAGSALGAMVASASGSACLAAGHPFQAAGRQISIWTNTYKRVPDLRPVVSAVGATGFSKPRPASEIGSLGED